MFADLQTDFNLSYILTHKLNQDAVENIFCQIRSRGGLNDHPTPRLRAIILGKTDIVQNNTKTVERTNDEHYIVCQVLRRSGIEVAILSAQTHSSSISSCSSDHLVVSG